MMNRGVSTDVAKAAAAAAVAVDEVVASASKLQSAVEVLEETLSGAGFETFPYGVMGGQLDPFINALASPW